MNTTDGEPTRSASQISPGRKIRLKGEDEDGVVLLNGVALLVQDAGKHSFEADGAVDGDHVTVRVAWNNEFEVRAELSNGAEVSLEKADNQPETGIRFHSNGVPGVDLTFELLPESEVDLDGR